MPRPRFQRLRKLFESIAYAGLQPGGSSAPSKNLRWLGPLRGPVERFLSGGPAPSDPLYLTNRTIGYKIKMATLIGIPCLLLAGGLYGVLTNSFDFGDTPEPKQPSPAEAAAKLLPHLDSSLSLETNHDVNVLEVRIEHGNPASLVGSLKNNTDHEIHIAEAVFELTDSGGSQLGAVSVKLENLKAGSTAAFRTPIEQTSAAFALVREVHSQ